MCGIVGFAHAEGSSAAFASREVLERMTQTLLHRGPDEAGLHLVTTPHAVAMGHRRLVVIDPEGGAQPMVFAERGLAVVYNGEIYNYRELNETLAAHGYHARSRSDTETLLHAYAHHGDECVSHLRGMFAFAIHDAERGRVFAARDPLGKKPFYYVHDAERRFFAFASEARALVEHPTVSRELDPVALSWYLQFEHVPAPQAIYKGMGKLQPGQRLMFDLVTGQLELSTYWDMADGLNRAATLSRDRDLLDEDACGERLRAKLLEAVERRLIADVPLGVFLSGGIDSSAVAAAMCRLRPPSEVKTFSIGFADPRFDEATAARDFAARLGTDHHERIMDERAALDVLPTLADHLDEPFADASVLPTYLLSKFARETVTVALGGDGGDELFAGYPTFLAQRPAGLYNAVVPGVLHRRLVAPLVNRIPPGSGYLAFDFKLKRLLRGVKCPEHQRLWRWLGAFTPDELPALLSPEVAALLDPTRFDTFQRTLHDRVAECDPIARDAYLFARSYLSEQVMVKVDRATMACSLEARSPLLDLDFVELALSIPSSLKRKGRRLKHIFRHALRDWLPADLLDRPKRGFATPLHQWLRGPLRDLLHDVLHREALREAGLFNADVVGRLVNEHDTGRADHRKPLWTLLMFELWRRRWA